MGYAAVAQADEPLGGGPADGEVVPVDPVVVVAQRAADGHEQKASSLKVVDPLVVRPRAPDEWWTLAVMLVLAIANVVLGVWHPRLSRRKARAPGHARSQADQSARIPGMEQAEVPREVAVIEAERVRRAG